MAIWSNRLSSGSNCAIMLTSSEWAGVILVDALYEVRYCMLSFRDSAARTSRPSGSLTRCAEHAKTLSSHRPQRISLLQGHHKNMYSQTATPANVFARMPRPRKLGAAHARPHVVARPGARAQQLAPLGVHALARAQPPLRQPPTLPAALELCAPARKGRAAPNAAPAAGSAEARSRPR